MKSKKAAQSLDNSVTGARPQRRTIWLLALLLAMAAANALLFPWLTGYQGGEKALPAARLALPHVAFAVANMAALAVLAMRLPDEGLKLWHVFASAIFTRLAYLALRLALGAGTVDPDVALFFRYGREFAAGQYPVMEYPQVALLLFTAGYLVAFGDAARFALVFPVFTMLADLVSLACLMCLGGRWQNRRIASVLAAFYAICPFTLVLWYSKFDGLPAAMLALGTAFFVARRQTSSALSLAAGFLTKWFPGIAAMFFALKLLRSRPRHALTFCLIGALAVLLPLAAFWLISPDRVLQTYRFHLNRPVMGQSIFYLPIYLLRPVSRLPLTAGPWTDVSSDLIRNGWATAVPVTGILLALAAAIVARRIRGVVVLSMVGVAIFILLNRVFSPQYLLVLIVAYILALVALPARSRALEAFAASFLLLLTLLNYLVWPLWSPFWVAASALFFTLNLLLVGWLAKEGWAVGTARDAARDKPAR